MFSHPMPIVILVVASVVTLLLSLFIGPMGFDVELLSLRAPRVFLGMFSGAALGISGTALQAMTRNSLADPYILGVSGGAAAFGTLSILLFHSSSLWMTPLAAWFGSIFVSLLLVKFLKREDFRSRDKILLLGIAFNSFASSFITVAKTIAPVQMTQTLLFWLVGSIGYVHPQWIFALLFLGVPCFILLLNKASALELLSLGDDEATRLGLDVAREKRLLYLCLSCLVGLSVSLCGMIAFVGLITPHLLRPFVGFNQRILVPSSALLGLIIVTSVDTLARYGYRFFETEIPAGALLALLGSPVFLWVLMSRGRHARS